MSSSTLLLIKKQNILLELGSAVSVNNQPYIPNNHKYIYMYISRVIRSSWFECFQFSHICILVRIQKHAYD